MGQRRGVPREITVRKCCRMSFLRGVFLACGSVTDPEKEYHLEFVLEDEAFAAALRLAPAERSLEELGRLCDPPVGKSGVNHRLRKLEIMAQELDGQETAENAEKGKADGADD